jgi:hypothetical protein
MKESGKNNEFQSKYSTYILNLSSNKTRNKDIMLMKFLAASWIGQYREVKS